MDFTNYDNTDIESNLVVDNNSPGLMSVNDKNKLDNILNIVNITQKEYNALETKDPNTLYLINQPDVTLSNNFRDTIYDISPPIDEEGFLTIHNIVFTKSAIPSNKISSASIVSTDSSITKAYAYLDGDTVYISPEEDNAIIYANEDDYGYEIFNGLEGITSIDLSNFNTSNLSSMNGMFMNCTTLTSIIGIENFDTSKVNDMTSMFSNCRSLLSLDLKNWDTSKVAYMDEMFYECTKLSGEITIMNPNITSYSSMFTGCATDTLNASSVRYIDDATHTIAQNMVATKSSNSKVYVYGEASGSPTAL